MKRHVSKAQKKSVRASPTWTFQPEKTVAEIITRELEIAQKADPSITKSDIINKALERGSPGTAIDLTHSQLDQLKLKIERLKRHMDAEASGHPETAILEEMREKAASAEKTSILKEMRAKAEKAKKGVPGSPESK